MAAGRVGGAADIRTRRRREGGRWCLERLRRTGDRLAAYAESQRREMTEEMLLVEGSRAGGAFGNRGLLGRQLKFGLGATDFSWWAPKCHARKAFHDSCLLDLDSGEGEEDCPIVRTLGVGHAMRVVPFEVSKGVPMETTTLERRPVPLMKACSNERTRW